jgi:uncharacterized membrane protein YjjP (DUF1212 family)
MSEQSTIASNKLTLFVCESPEVSGEVNALLTEIQRNVQDKVQQITFKGLLFASFLPKFNDRWSVLFLKVLHSFIVLLFRFVLKWKSENFIN